MNEHSYFLNNFAETAAFGLRLAPHLQPPLSVGLIGELGSGKTTIVRHLCHGLGAVSPVSSPSFILAHDYDTKTNLVIEHWDLYRIESLPEELREAPHANLIRFIEWPDKIEGYPETLDLLIRMEIAATNDEPNRRSLIITGSKAGKVPSIS